MQIATHTHTHTHLTSGSTLLLDTGARKRRPPVVVVVEAIGNGREEGLVF